MKNLFRVLIVAFLGFGISAFARAEQLSSLEYLTEAYPPYNFQEEGRLRGIAVDLLLAALKQNGQPITVQKIKVLPWARAYKMTTAGPNRVLFSTTRTEARETLFQWVGPISPTRVVLLAKKSKGIKINSEADIAKYTVGAIRDDVGEQLVNAAGVPSDKVNKAAQADSLVKMLANDRIQLWAYEENVARWFIKQEGFDNANFEVVYVLKESDLYYSFSKDVPAALVEELQNAIDAVKQKSTGSGKTRYEEILADYL